MNQDYLKFKCINKMESDYKSRFIDLVNEYEPKLNKVFYDGESIFTMHDFDHHCIDLYKIVSEYILNPNIAYIESDSALNARELYILNIAILLHDIGMTKCTFFDRGIHSKVSADIIRDDYRNPSNPLSEGKSGLTKNEIEALALIVQAHSDIKDGNIKACENGLNNPALKNDMSGKIEQIRAKLLAYILRMADELDITTDRIGAQEVENDLEKVKYKYEDIKKQLKEETDTKKKEKLEKELDKSEKMCESLEHFKKLYYFKEITIDEGGVANIIIDEQYIKEEIENGEECKHIAKIVNEVFDKVSHEFTLFNTYITKNLEFRTLISLTGMKLISSDSDLNEYIEDIEESYENDENSAGIVPKLISEDIKELIKEFVDKKNIYRVGHFYLSNEVCARDWIDVNEIIETEEIFKKCQTQFLLHMQNTIKDSVNQYLMIGVDFGGMLIASRLSYIFQMPYTYVVPNNKESSSSIKDIKAFTAEFSKVILITDVIVSYSQIKSIIKKNELEEKLFAIYAVLFRDTSKHKYIKKMENADLIEKTYVLNDTFPIELQENKHCQYKDSPLCKSCYKIYG